MLDRGQMYGDGFFETMLMINGKIPLIRYHFERMLRTALKLKMDLPEELLELDSFENLLEQFNDTPEPIRVRMNVIRTVDGFYLPRDNSATYNFNVQPAMNPLNKEKLVLNRVGIAGSVTIYSKGLSNYKTLSKSEQVLLSIECKERGLDDLIVLNENGEIVECIYSNIFFIQKDGLHVTPSLESGCLDGCMRRYLIANQLKHSVVIIERPILANEVPDFNSCYCSNSIGGIRNINTLDGIDYTINGIFDHKYLIDSLMNFIE